MARSSQPVPDQELQRTVEADVGQRRNAIGQLLQRRRPEAKRSGSGRPAAGSDVPALRRTAGSRRPAGRRETVPISVSPSKLLPSGHSPGAGDADDRRQAARLPAQHRLARGAHRGERDHLDLGAGERRPRDGAFGEPAQDRLQPVVAGVVQLVGLGGGEQDPVGARAETARSARLPRPTRKQSRIAASAPCRSRTACGPPSSAASSIDQHDLPVEPGEMVAEERPHHDVAIGLVAPRASAPSCEPGGGSSPAGSSQRREGQRRRAGEVARHQEAPRRRSGSTLSRLAAAGGR